MAANGTRDGASQRTLANGIRYVSVDGLRVRVSVEGDGRCLLLLNGIGANLELLAPLRRVLSGTRTICYDAPGTGGSDTPRCPKRFSRLADWAVRILDAVDADRVDVLGYSWGGALAQQLARRHPSRVRKLVLCATATGMIMVPGRPRVLLRMASPRRYYSRSYLLEVAAQLYGGAIRGAPELLEQQVLGRLKRPPTLRGYAWQLAAGLGWTSIHWLHRLQQPTLVIAGDDDPIVPLVNARILAALIPNARLRVVTGGGHLLCIERPELVASEIETFLEES